MRILPKKTVIMLEEQDSKEIPSNILNSIINHYNKGEFILVIKTVETLIIEFPNSTFLFNILGSANLSLKKFLNAIKNFHIAAKNSPLQPEIYYNLGLSYHLFGNINDAIFNYNKALELKPNYSEAYCNLGMAQSLKGDLNDSILSFKKSIKFNPYHAGSYFNLGNTYARKGRNNFAINNYKKAISLNPNYYQSFINLGNVYKSIGKLNDSIYNYKKSIKLNPQSYESFSNLSLAYLEKKDFKSAINNAKHAIRLKRSKSEAYQNIGSIYFKLKIFYLAKKYFETALQQKEYSNYLYGNFALSLMNLFDFKEGIKNLKISFKKCIEEINISRDIFDNVSQIFFGINYLPNSSAEEVFSYYQQFDHKFGLPLHKEWQPFPLIKEQKSKLKIGYVSPDFKKHSVQHHLLPVLANHNHDQFEIYAFAELSEEDPVTQQYKSYVDHWIPTQGLSDEEMVQKIRELQIDILVDLAGHTKDNRLLVFARKPAPVSLTWLGYGYTTGLSAIDYFLTDKITAPKGSEHLFSEQIWQLNHYGHCCYQEQLDMGHVGPLPALEKGHITFGTLTRAIRINDRVIKAWSQILKRVKHSKLVINSADFSHYKTKRMIISKFEEYGVKQNCLEVGYQSPPWDTMRQIDIALDCFPHNSGTTLIEHLYMGNPFVTYSNRPSVGKIGASILTALGRREWIAYSEQEYIDKAVALATDTKKLASIRSSLREEMKRSPIMDHKGFVRELERTYQSMWKNYLEKG